MLGWTTLRPLLAFVVGFVDTAVFVHMGGLFVAHVTGNVVLLGATLAGIDGEGAASLQLLTFPIFFATAAVAAWIASAIRARGRDFTPPLLWLATFAMIVGAALPLLGRIFDPAAAMVFVVAMATLNAVHRLDPRIGAPFTVMTGNVTGLAVALAQAVGAAPSLPPAKRSMPAILLLLGFAIGATAGAIGVSRLGLPVIALPGLLLALHLALLAPSAPAE